MAKKRKPEPLSPELNAELLELVADMMDDEVTAEILSHLADDEEAKRLFPVDDLGGLV